MKVRDLIKDTVWRPGRDYDGPPPTISVLLPTYRRGADGLFLKVAHSVLNQTFRNLELIVVDDASTDGTADQIRRLMEEDPRVSCLTHVYNIGLPAISEYEGYVRARGTHIAFAFDDFVFDPDALSALFEAATAHSDSVVHGYADWIDEAGTHHQLGQAPLPHELLNFYNFLSNPSFLVPKSVVEEVGLYDPHIAAVRLCDWDLWRRIYETMPIRRMPILVGLEYGVTRSDSLCNSYPLHAECMQEYFGIRRNERLKPCAFSDFDIWEMPADSSVSLTEHILNTRRFFQNKTWAPKSTERNVTELLRLFRPATHVIGIFGFIEPSSSLIFDSLLYEYARNLQFIAPELDDSFLRFYIARCDALIVVRQLFGLQVQRAIAIARAMNVPLYYYTDDNFIALSDLPEYGAYSLDAVRQVLRQFKGVLVTSPKLADYYEMFQIHRFLQMVRPSLDVAKVKKLGRVRTERVGKALRIGFIGGIFRSDNLIADVVPALAKLSASMDIEFMSRSSTALPTEFPVSVEHIDFSPSLDEFLLRWKRRCPDVLVHPIGKTENIDYKTDNFLLIARYLGAVPVVCDEPAFDGVGEEQGVVRSDGSVSGWMAAIERLKSADVRAKLVSRLTEYCDEAFSPITNRAALERLFRENPSTDLLTWTERIRTISEGSSLSPADAAHVAKMEAELSSRAYQFALKLRKISAGVRRVGAYLEFASN